MHRGAPVLTRRQSCPLELGTQFRPCSVHLGTCLCCVADVELPNLLEHLAGTALHQKWLRSPTDLPLYKLALCASQVFTWPPETTDLRLRARTLNQQNFDQENQDQKRCNL